MSATSIVCVEGHVADIAVRDHRASQIGVRHSPVRNEPEFIWSRLESANRMGDKQKRL
jgi:hypothetical protein